MLEVRASATETAQHFQFSRGSSWPTPALGMHSGLLPNSWGPWTLPTSSIAFYKTSLRAYLWQKSTQSSTPPSSSHCQIWHSLGTPEFSLYHTLVVYICPHFYMITIHELLQVHIGLDSSLGQRSCLLIFLLIHPLEFCHTIWHTRYISFNSQLVKGENSTPGLKQYGASRSY